MKTKGWKEVFAFTFTQQIKTKSFIIGTLVITLIVALMSATANILPTFFIGGDDTGAGASSTDAFTVKTLYISNETDCSFDFTAPMKELGVTVTNITADEFQSKITELANTSEQAMAARIYMNEDVLTVDSKYAGGDSIVTKGDSSTVASLLTTQINAQFLVLSGLPADKLVTAISGVNMSLSCAGEEAESMITTMIKSVVPMISSIVLFIFIFSYSQLVAQAIAIEKSSRIVEYLLTSIKPLALIIGKVLAMCCVSLMQFIIIGMGGGLGFLISMPFGIFTKLGTIMESAAAAGGAAPSENATMAQGIIDEIGKAFSNVDASAIIMMIITFVLGFLLYAGMAGVAGASVSKMEDLAPAIQPLSIIGVLGFYLAYFPQVAGEENALSTLARYLPISSPFILTSDYMLGKIGLVETLIAIAIMIAADIGIMVLVAKVYENIILHTGSRLKLGDMLKMSK